MAFNLKKIFYVFLMIFWISGFSPSVYAETSSYEKDQAIDEKYNFFQVISHYINHLRTNSYEKQPAEIESGGLPPYHQQAERASNVGLDEARSTCIPSKGHPCP